MAVAEEKDDGRDPRELAKAVMAYAFDTSANSNSPDYMLDAVSRLVIEADADKANPANVSHDPNATHRDARSQHAYDARKRCSNR